MWSARYAWSFVLVIAHLVAIAQPPAPGFLSRIPITGLPVTEVHCMAFDHDGFLWLGTGNGLCRFDGVNVDVLRNDPRDTTSLPGNVVFSMLLLGDHRLLVGTQCGMALVDPRNLRAQRIHMTPPFGTGPRMEIGGLTAAPDGTVWVGSAGGVLHFDPRTGTVSKLFPSEQLPAIHERPSVHNIVLDDDGGLWVTNRGSLLHITADHKHVEHFSYVDVPPHPSPKPLLSQLMQDPDDPDMLFIGTWGSGLLRFNKATREFTCYKMPSPGPWNLTNIVFNVLPIGQGRALVGMEHAWRWCDVRTGLFSKGFAFANEPRVPTAYESEAVTLDHEGRIWMADFTGLYVSYLPDKQPVELLNPGLLSSSVVLSRSLERSGWWAARFYSHRYLFALDSLAVPFDSIAIPDGERLQIETQAMLQAHDGQVYLATTDGLLCYHPQERRFELIHLPVSADRDSIRPTTHSIMETVEGDLWVSAEAGTFLRKHGTQRFLRMSRTPEDPDKPIPWGGQLLRALDKDHLVTASPWEGSITVIDLRNHAATTITHDDPRTPDLTDMVAVAPGKDNWIHVVTRSNGVLSLHYAGDTFDRTLQHKETNPLNQCVDATTDDRGRVWIAANGATVRFDPGTGTFTQLTERDGLLYGGGCDMIMNDGPHRMIERAPLYSVFDPLRIARPTAPAGCYFRSVRANGAHVPLLFQAKTLLLSHTQKNISIEYAPIDPLHGDLIQYEYKLEGHDERWVSNGTQRTVSYAGLAPGEYTFRMRMAGISGPRAGLSLTIHIVPAFWQTGWFKALLVSILALSVFMLSRYILRLQYAKRFAALERQRAVERVRTRIARDIHDDLGSGLTRITMLSREMGSTPDKEKLAAQIADSSSELIGQLSETVWAVNPANDDAERFIAYIRDQLGRQFEDLSVQLRTELSTDPDQAHRDIPPDVKRNVVLILKECVSNALKHAQASTITVELHIGRAELTLRVQDDGRGFDAQDITRGNGLGNLEKRTAELNGRIARRSDASGTEYCIEVPLPTPTFMRPS